MIPTRCLHASKIGDLLIKTDKDTGTPFRIDPVLYKNIRDNPVIRSHGSLLEVNEFSEYASIKKNPHAT